ncbi:MAG: D-lyxose/D-mannose family sugar isomerase [candidate division Zixibacteria bacterium]|nr:D-lyxose/D-mannose family sugar isomerase [candidate division Zixibacteria bacterium]
MKRSEINALIRDAITFLDEMAFRLPKWAYWKPEEWKLRGHQVQQIVDLMLGWDITDFGEGDFGKKGLILFTIRNGDFRERDNRKCYAEKIMVVRENQETPLHFHWTKMEDIINRGGGNLVMELCGSTEDEQLSDKPVAVRVDEILRTVEPMGQIILAPGESIGIEPRLYHRFYGEEGKGRVLVGEVSSVNDDTSDNRFYECLGRFPEIEEDEKPLHLLVTDYPNYLDRD